MSRASLRAKSPQRRRKKRSTFRRRAFGGQSMQFGGRAFLPTTTYADYGLKSVVDVVNSLFRRIYQARGQ